MQFKYNQSDYICMDDRESKKNNRFLSFSLGSEEFAIPLLLVKEVIAVPETTATPFIPSYSLGIMNLRGLVISILDLRKKLGIKPKGKGEPAVIICDLGDESIGVVVDSINSVIFPQANEISEHPAVNNDEINIKYINGIYRKETNLVLLLNIEKILDLKNHLTIKANRPHAA